MLFRSPYQTVFSEAQKRGWINPSSKSAQITPPVTHPIEGKSQRTVITRRGADIEPKPINWLWDGWLPSGKLTLLAGAAGTGKTTLTMGLASALTSGGIWPDGKHCNQLGNILIWSSEDDHADTLVPRLIAAGADMRRCHFIDGITQKGEKLPFDPSKDIPDLLNAVERIGGVSLLIIDPIVSAVAGDMHRANDVRRSLQPVVDFAAAHHCAVVGITHFAKGGVGSTTQDRVIGSQAFVALARMLLVATKSQDGSRRALVRDKSNISRDDGGIEYSLESCNILNGIETTRVIWNGVLDGTSLEIFKDIEGDECDNEFSRDDLKTMLVDTLKNNGGWMYFKQLEEKIVDAGYSVDSAKRYKRQLGIVSEKSGMKGQWIWRISGKTT